MRILKSVVLVNVAILILSIFSFAVMAQTDSEEKNIFSNDMKIQGDALTCLSAPSCSECSAGSSAVITSP